MKDSQTFTLANEQKIWSMPLALGLGLLLMPFFAAVISQDQPRDFVQEWASARNYFQDRPIYESQRSTLWDYLGIRVGTTTFTLEYNAHPPTSVLLVLPLGLLEYGKALLAFNLLSLAALLVVFFLLARQWQLEITPNRLCWLLAAIVTAGIISPLREQLLHGQWNLLLLLLITGAWVLDQRQRPAWAGCLLGLAISIKLFPGFLLLYYLARQRWTVLLMALATLGGITMLTIAILGFECYRDYVVRVLPTLQVYRSSWPGLSLNNFWCKLFDPVALTGMTEPIIHSPLMARILTLVSVGCLAGCVAWISRWAATPNAEQRAFALLVVGMLLASPIAWDHYLVLLILPAALFWRTLDARQRPLFLAILMPLILHRYFLWAPLVCDPRLDWTQMTARPWQVLTGLSIHFYALIAWFFLGMWAPLRVEESA